MTAIITAELIYDIEASILKTIYSEPFSSEVLKVQIFILQIDNKIADAAETSEERKI